MDDAQTSWRRPVHAIRRLLIRPHRDVRLALIVWGTLAAICLASGPLLGRFGCYGEVRYWLTIWGTGLDVYQLPLGVDYPPHTLVFFSPLLLFPAHYGATLFAVLNVLVCIAAAWSIVALTSGYAGWSLSRRERLAYVLMLLVWSPTRVGIWAGQTSPAMILCCCLALRLSASQPVLAGLLLGVGASKPHIALGFYLMAVYCRMWTTVAIAVATVSSAVLAYAWSVARSPVEVMAQYISTLFSVYSGPRFYRGEVDLRPLFVDLIGFGEYQIGESLYLATMLVTGVALLWLAWRVRNRFSAAVWVLAAGLTWTTAFLPVNRYGVTLIAPTVLLTLWRPNVSRFMLNVIAVVIAVIVADLPTLARHGMLSYLPAPIAHLAPHIHYFDRFVIGACLVISFTALVRASRAVPNASTAA